MSLGFYLATHQPLRLANTKNADTLDLNSLTDLEKNAPQLLEDLTKNLGIDQNNIDPSEKLFVILPEKFDEQPFEIIAETEPETIARYTKTPFLYYIDIYNWDNFYPSLSEYLLTLNQSFELWLIWENKFEPEDVSITKLNNLTEKNIADIFGDNEYLHPIVGIYHYEMTPSE